ncbi:MAG: hypothetical protein HS126_20335 [Anaerolineales bacterium]|nr:hypothetical protein [Anaerolineales bacterium]
MKQAVSTTHEQARRMGAPRAIALCQCFNGALEFQAGHWAAAEAAPARIDPALPRDRRGLREALACQRLGVLQTARGQLALGQTTLEEGVMAAEQALMRGHRLARLYAAMACNRPAAGDPDAPTRPLTLAWR